MAFSTGVETITLEDIADRVTEAEILSFYLGIHEIPCVVHSPLREDKKPSFGIYSKDGKKILYKDLSTGDSGGLYDLLGQMWGCSLPQIISKVYKDIDKMNSDVQQKEYRPCNIYTIGIHKSKSKMEVKTREWRDYDLEYWNSFGISLKWLKYAEIYPISHKIVTKEGKRYVMNADKYAYVYVEHKEGKTTLKVYQPFNKQGYKWASKHDTSVISLWTKIPKEGNAVCICASMKDALTLWSNTGIPSIAIQGEGYNMSDTAVNELKRRFKKVFIMLDNDEPGLIDGRKLSKSTGFTNVVLPRMNGSKDISDYYKSLHDKQLFKPTILKLFKDEDKKRTLCRNQEV